VIVRRFDMDRWKQKRDGRARAGYVAQSNAAVRTSREIAGAAAHHVMTGNADPAHVVMQPIERCVFQLCKPLRDEATQLRERSGQRSVQPHVQTMRQKVPPGKVFAS
jgi:hypothetical protein